MKVVLHVGAHRTASTSFQAYMRQNARIFNEAGLGFWGPGRTRKGLLTGVIPSGWPSFGRDQEKRASGRIQLELDRAENRGLKTLLISEENMIGSVRGAHRDCKLYSAIGERMARYNWAFEDRVSKVVLTIRSHELWWSSALAYAVQRGASVVQAGDCGDILDNSRSWRHVITDLACAMPEAEVLVLPFERFAGRPSLTLKAATGHNGPVLRCPDWLNRAPDLAMLRTILEDRREDTDQVPPADGRWMPFSAEQRTELRQRYVDDLYWLSSGADGLATLIEDPEYETWRDSRALTDRGHAYADKEERMAQPG